MSERLFEIGDWIVEKAIALRSRTSNRLARIVVIAGLALFVEPFWAPYVQALFENQFGVQIDTSGATWPGFALVVVGLTYHYLVSKQNRGELSFSASEISDHDSLIL